MSPQAISCCSIPAQIVSCRQACGCGMMTILLEPDEHSGECGSTASFFTHDSFAGTLDWSASGTFDRPASGALDNQCDDRWFRVSLQSYCHTNGGVEASLQASVHSSHCSTDEALVCLRTARTPHKRGCLHSSRAHHTMAATTAHVRHLSDVRLCAGHAVCPCNHCVSLHSLGACLRMALAMAFRRIG